MGQKVSPHGLRVGIIKDGNFLKLKLIRKNIWLYLHQEKVFMKMENYIQILK